MCVCARNEGNGGKETGGVGGVGAWLRVLSLPVNTSQAHANTNARVSCKLRMRANRTRPRSREDVRTFEHVRTFCAAMEMQTLASLRAHASQANANTHARLTRKLRTRRARASNTHVPPALRSSCKRAVLARAVHDHRETTTDRAQSCGHACARGGQYRCVTHTVPDASTADAPSSDAYSAAT